MDKLIGFCTFFLGIQNPVEVRIRETLKIKDARAYHVSWAKGNKITRHVIYINMQDDARDIETICAHEFVHAWQAEYAPKSKTHGKLFANKCAELREFLISEGFNIRDDIYCKKTDK
jgi:hypothetical protein